MRRIVVVIPLLVLLAGCSAGGASETAGSAACSVAQQAVDGVAGQVDGIVDDIGADPGAARDALAGLAEPRFPVAPENPPTETAIIAPTQETRDNLWRNAGLARDAAGLQLLAADPHPLAQIVAACAMLRQESRGAHFRTDFPDIDPALHGHHAVVRNGGAPAFELRFLVGIVSGSGSHGWGSQTSQQRPSGAPAVLSLKWSSSWRRRQRSE